MLHTWYEIENSNLKMYHVLWALNYSLVLNIREISNYFIRLLTLIRLRLIIELLQKKITKMMGHLKINQQTKESNEQPSGICNAVWCSYFCLLRTPWIMLIMLFRASSLFTYPNKTRISERQRTGYIAYHRYQQFYIPSYDK